MPLVRLFGVIILAGCLPAFGQIQKENAPTPDLTSGATAPMPEQVTTPEPWRIFPDRPPDATSAQDFRTQLRIDGGKTDLGLRSQLTSFDANSDKGILLTPTGDLVVDKTCYAIRSYMVARDDKESDSTHPVGYSTCQLAARYHVKKIEVPPSTKR